MKRLMIFLLLAIILGGVWYGYKKYTGKVPSLTEEKTDARLSAADLVAAFEKDSASATKKYLGKILEVTGSVKAIEKDEATVVLQAGSGNSTLRCSMDSNFVKDIITLNPGSHLTIKGHCTGFRADDTGLGLGADVVLNRCVLPDKQ